MYIGEKVDLAKLKPDWEQTVICNIVPLFINIIY